MTTAQIFAPFLGALVLEAIHWYELREKLDLKKYRSLIRSPIYWTVTLAMVLLGGAATLYIFGGLGLPQLTVAGAALPAVFKKLIKAVPKPKLTFGEEDSNFTLGDYFEV